MPKVCVLLANGFEEIEAVTIIDVLRRAEIDTRIAGVDSGTPTGAHGIKVTANIRLKAAADVRWDMIVLPGGARGAHTLRDNDEVQALLKKHAEHDGPLAAICAAPIALSRAGLLTDRKATCYPSFKDELTDANYVEETVVRDGDLITSRGPGTALPFSLALVAHLTSEGLAKKIASQMLVEAA